MALPEGIQTGTVTFGSAVTYGGRSTSAVLVVKASARLVYDPDNAGDGIPILNFPETAIADDGAPGQMYLPVCNQTGFKGTQNGTMVSITGWSYTGTLTWTDPTTGLSDSVTKVFQVLEGQTTIDFDRLPDTVGVLPVTAPVVGVTSFLGKTGPIVEDDLSGIGGGLSEAEADTRYAPLWQPNKAYLAGDPVLLPNGSTGTRTTDGTSRATFDATEEAAWTVAAGGGLDKSEADSLYATPALALSRPRTSPPPVSNMLAPACAPGHGWTMSGVSASSEMNDTTDFAIGTQSARYTTNGVGGLPNLEKTLDAPIDLTGKYLRIWIKISDYSRLQGLTLWAGDSTLANRYVGELFTGSLEELKSNLRGGEWTALDVAMSDLNQVTGTPNAAAIQKLRIRAYDKSNGALTFWFGGLAVVNPPAGASGGVVTLTFDDSYSAAFTVARPRMDVRGYAGTMFPIIDQLGGANKLTVAQMRQLQNVHGWEVGSHATSSAAHGLGFAGRTEADLKAEMLTIQQWNVANGFAASTFAYPVATFDALGEEMAGRFFRHTRTTNTKINETVPPSAPHRIRAVAVGASTTLAELQTKIAQAKAGNSWLVLIYHDIVASGPVGNASLTSLFESTLAEIAAQGVRVRTMAQALAL